MVGSANEQHRLDDGNGDGNGDVRVITMPAATEAPPKFTTRPTAATWYPEKTTSGQLESKSSSRIELSNDAMMQIIKYSTI